MTRRRVLIVEDERSISEPLESLLGGEGFDVEVAADGHGGLAAAEQRPPDIVLLDIGLPDVDGRDVCRSMRTRSQVPIIMLTARGSEIDRIVGLELGADDYVVKPFSAGELVARMRALLRRAERTSGAPAPDTLTIGDVTVDARTWTATLRGEPVELTRKEFELLRLLMQHAGTLLTREQLIDEVWDPHWFGSTKTLDVHIGQLRRKLGDDPAKPRYVHTIRGVGFRFASAAEIT